MLKLGSIPQITAAVSAMLSMVSFGFHAGWPSPTLVKLLAKDSDIPITSSQGAWMVGCMSMGWIFASGFIPILTDTWGRKKIMLLLSIPCLAGNIMIVFATTYWLLCLARFLIGISIGVTLIGGMMYTSEVSEDRLRGALGTLLNNMNNFGLLIAYCVGPWLSRAALAMVGAAIPAIFVLTFVWMPESPYFLVMKKKHDEARKSLIWLRGREDVTEDLKTIARNVEFDQNNVGSYKELLMKPANRRALVITNGLMFAQEFSGIAAINAYSSLIFEASGAKLSTDISLMIVALIQLLSGASAAYVVTLAGRRKLLFISVAGTVFFLSCEALYFQLQHAGVDVSSVFWLPLAGIVGFVVFYTVGLGILPGSINPEVYPCNLRAKGLSVTNTATLISMTIVTQVYQIIADAFGIQSAFWSFAGITVCSGIFIYFFVPETRNRSISDIHSHLRHITRTKSVRRAEKENPEPSVSQISAIVESTRAGEALYFQLKVAGIDVEPIYWLPVTGIVGYMFSYTLGLGCLPFAVLGEIFPRNVKAKATMIGAVTGALGGAIVTLFYQMITDAAGIQNSFWSFAAISIGSAIFIYFLVPETKQRSLRDIQNEFQNGNESKSALRTVYA